MNIVMKSDEESRHVIILNTYGLVLSTAVQIPRSEQHFYDGETERVNQVGVRYEDLDTHIGVMTALRNANRMGINMQEKELHECRDYVGIFEDLSLFGNVTGFRILGYKKLYIESGNEPYLPDHIALMSHAYAIGETIVVEKDEVKRFPAVQEETDYEADDFEAGHPGKEE